MSTSVLPPGVLAAKFKDLDINVRMLEWSDSRKPRLAVHEFLKRDGALIEPMGRAPFRVKMELVFIGQTIADDIKTLAASIDDNPKGTLSHPLFGDIQVACEGFDGSLTVETGRNMYSMPISFVEDNVDAKIVAQTQGVGAQQQQVTNVSGNLLNQATKYLTAAIAITNLCEAATSFAASAFSNQSSFNPVAGLQTQLQSLALSTTQTVEAIRADPASQPEPLSYDAVVQCEMLYDACVQMLAAISVAKPPLTTFIVPLQMHVANLAVKLYGAQGRDRISEILALNAGLIPNPSAIPAGTTLQVYQS